jgi:hypothetical protein
LSLSAQYKTKDQKYCDEDNEKAYLAALATQSTNGR